MTLRDAIKEGLGDDWTKTREDGLFWALADFMDRVRENSICSLSGAPKDWPESTKRTVRQALESLGRMLE